MRCASPAGHGRAPGCSSASRSWLSSRLRRVGKTASVSGSTTQPDATGAHCLRRHAKIGARGLYLIIVPVGRTCTQKLAEPGARSANAADLSIAAMTSWRRTASTKSDAVCAPWSMSAVNAAHSRQTLKAGGSLAHGRGPFLCQRCWDSKLDGLIPPCAPAKVN